MNNYLKREIIRHILANFGITLDSKLPARMSFMTDDFLLQEEVTFEVGENVVSAPTWGAQFELAGSLIRGIICDMTAEGVRDFALVFRIGDLPSYGIRLSDDPADVGNFSWQAAKGRWNEGDTYIQATALAGFEQVTTLHISWKPLADSEDFFELLIDFLHNGAE